jgi:hypothetical protein
MSADRVPVPIFYGDIGNGKINLGDDRAFFSNLLKALEGKEIAIAMWERFDPEDILQLRGYFHGYVLPAIALASGENKITPEVLDRVKRGLKILFLTDPATGKVPSTESLKKGQYWQFIENCRQYSAETLCHYIDDPDRARLQRAVNRRTPPEVAS